MIYLTQADIDRESKLIKEEAYRRKLKTELDKQGISYFENAPTKELKGQLNKGKEDNRLRAADLVFKVKGSYAPIKTANVNAEIKLNELTDEELAEMAYKQPDVPVNEALQAPTIPAKE